MGKWKMKLETNLELYNFFNSMSLISGFVSGAFMITIYKWIDVTSWEQLGLLTVMELIIILIFYYSVKTTNKYFKLITRETKGD